MIIFVIVRFSFFKVKFLKMYVFFKLFKVLREMRSVVILRVNEWFIRRDIVSLYF